MPNNGETFNYGIVIKTMTRGHNNKNMWNTSKPGRYIGNTKC